MGLFKEIGDWWDDLFKKNVSKTDEQELIKKLANMEAAERERLNKIVKEYGESFRPEDITFEYLEEYTPIDEETLRADSEKEYSEIYNAEKDKVNSNYENKKYQLEETEKGYIADAEAKNNNYKEKYKDKTESFKSSASKNGIADSSIMGAKTKDIDDERDRFISEVMATLQNKLTSTANKKNDILQDKNDKIQSLDDNFNKNVENLFNKLLKEENDKVKEVEKANKETAAKEKAYKEYQERVVQDKENEMKALHKQMKEDEDIGKFESTERADEYEDRLNFAKEFYSRFTKKSAINAIENNESLRNFLGSKYHILLEEIANG